MRRFILLCMMLAVLAGGGCTPRLGGKEQAPAGVTTPPDTTVEFPADKTPSPQ